MKNSIILCRVIALSTIYLVIDKFHTIIFNWNDNGIVVKAQNHVIVYLSKVF
jgi:hypothetical protein